jgi:hypothetical protein
MLGAIGMNMALMTANSLLLRTGHQLRANRTVNLARRRTTRYTAR